LKFSILYDFRLKPFLLSVKDVGLHTIHR